MPEDPRTHRPEAVTLGASKIFQKKFATTFHVNNLKDSPLTHKT
jgi:hypothetical protein